MGVLFDLFPLLAFLLAYFFNPGETFAFPTIILVVAMGMQVLIQRIKHGSAKKMHLYSFLLLLPFAAMTIIADNPAFLAWKFSIFYWAVGLAMLGVYYFKKINLFQKLFITIEKQFDAVPINVWARCNSLYALFMVAMGTINIFIYYIFSNPAAKDFSVWLSFKVFGGIGLNLVVIIGIMIYIFKHLPEEDKEKIQSQTSTPDEGH